MITTRRALVTLLFSLVLVTTALAQTPRETALPIDAPPARKQPATQSSIPLVTATASSQRVRYISIGEVQQTRLQVFAGDGTQVFDSDFKLGNLIDWQLTDQQGSRLTDGSYLFLVTVKDFSGTLTQKYGTATFEHEQVYLQQSAREELAAGQATALEANRQSELLSTIDRIGVAAVPGTTTAATDGTTALDGAPTGKKTTTPPTTAGGTNITGTGTQNKLAKWTDNAGTLGDSTITESTSGNLGVGTAPGTSIKLNVFSPFGTVPFSFTQNAPASSSPSLALFSTSDGVIGQYAASTNSGAISFVMGATAGNNFGIFANNAYGAPQLFIKNNGNIGIGTTNPANSLDVNGGVQMTPGGSGGKIQFGTPNAETGMTITGTNRADVRFDGTTLKLLAGTGVTSPANGVAIDTAGNVGIGNFAPQGKLVVSAGGSGGEVRFHTPNGESGMSIIGTNRADVRFDGTTLKLLAGTGPGAMASTNGININGSGNVGIGTTTPGAKLDVVAGGTAINAASQANAVIGVSSTANYAAIYGENTSSAGGPGVYGKGTSGYAMYAEGNAAQSRDKGGWVKAMALINRDGVVVRCYNSQLAGSAASTLPCGITVVHSASGGVYDVTFNSLQVDDRFISVTASRDTDYMVANIGAISGNTVEVDTALNSETNSNRLNSSPAQFTIFIF